VPHLELSVSEPNATREPGAARGPSAAQRILQPWADAIVRAADPCLILDTDAVVIAISAALRELLDLHADVSGRDLLDGVLQPLDFADGGLLDDAEIGKIPPLLALTSRRLARGLLRVRCADGPCTLDAIATPLTDGNEAIAGSLTFFSRV
jgi:hypothetical protein